MAIWFVVPFGGMLRCDREQWGLRECRMAWFLGLTVREYRELEAVGKAARSRGSSSSTGSTTRSRLTAAFVPRVASRKGAQKVIGL